MTLSRVDHFKTEIYNAEIGYYGMFYSFCKIY